MQKEDYYNNQLKTQIDEFWFQVENSYDIESREYFEQMYPDNPLGMAVHYMWKRDVRERKKDDDRCKVEGVRMWTGILRSEVRDSEDLDDGC